MTLENPVKKLVDAELMRQIRSGCDFTEIAMEAVLGELDYWRTRAKCSPDGMKMYIVVHRHRHGEDVWPVFSTGEPDTEEIIDELRSEDVWEDGQGEELEIYGGFAEAEIRSLAPGKPSGDAPESGGLRLRWTSDVNGTMHFGHDPDTDEPVCAVAHDHAAGGWHLPPRYFATEVVEKHGLRAFTGTYLLPGTAKLIAEALHFGA